MIMDEHLQGDPRPAPYPDIEIAVARIVFQHLAAGAAHGTSRAPKHHAPTTIFSHATLPEKKSKVRLEPQRLNVFPRRAENYNAPDNNSPPDI